MNKIAILILGHKNLEQIYRYIRTFNPSLYDIYIHIDLRCDRSEEAYKKIASLSNVFLFSLEESEIVDRGRFSIVSAEIKLIKRAIEKKYVYYIFSSGQDFLIKTSEELYTYINKNLQYCFDYLVEKPTSKFLDRNILKIYSFCYKRDFMSKLFKKIYFSKLNIFKKFFVRKDYKNIKTNIEFKFGSQWLGMNYDEALKCIVFIKTNTWYYEYMQKSLIPDECFFQTILWYNKAKFRDTLFYINWGENKSSPKVLGMEDLSEIRNSNKFIARKFDSKVNNEILNYLESEILN